MVAGAVDHAGSAAYSGADQDATGGAEEEHPRSQRSTTKTVRRQITRNMAPYYQGMGHSSERTFKDDFLCTIISAAFCSTFVSFFISATNKLLNRAMKVVQLALFRPTFSHDF